MIRKSIDALIGPMKLTKLDPERRSLSDLRLDAQAATAELHDLPHERKAEARAFPALLAPHLSLVERG